MQNLNLKLPTNIEISSRNDGKTFIQIHNTKFWIVGERLTGNLWDVWIIDPEEDKKEILRKNTTTTAFVLFCNVVLKTPFPTGKKETKFKAAKEFIKKLNIKTNGQHSNRIRSTYKRSKRT